MSDDEAVIGLLWSEIPLERERFVLDRLKREGLYEAWEAALDAAIVEG